MICWTSRLRNVQIWEHTFTLDLLTHDGVCRGALVNDRQYGQTLVWAKQTILCTGGTGQIYRESTNPRVATGDGHAMAYRAGVELRDMEFMQFHPTVLYIAGSSRSLITEAMRGEGACLVDRSRLSLHARLRRAGRTGTARCRGAGHRHADGEDVASVRVPRPDAPGPPVRAEPLPGHRGQVPGVWHRHHERPDSGAAGSPLHDRRRDGRRGRAAPRCPGLWAAGEATSSGLHGANRLASNSLLEALVFGAHAGTRRLGRGRQQTDDFSAPCRWRTARWTSPASRSTWPTSATR